MKKINTKTEERIRLLDLFLEENGCKEEFYNNISEKTLHDSLSDIYRFNNVIQAGFIWDTTNEGYEYWLDISERLVKWCGPNEY